MAIELETVRREEFFAQCVKVSGGNLEGAPAVLAGQMSVHGTGEVVHRSLLSEVRVDHDAELLKLLQDPIDRRRTHVRESLLYGESDLIGGEVTRSVGEHLSDRALSDRYAFRGTMNNGDNGVLVGARGVHGPRLGPSGKAPMTSKLKYCTSREDS